MKHDKAMKLFQYQKDKWVTYGDIVNSLKAVGADKCKILLLHTGITFGLPARELKRRDIAAILYDAITELGVKTLCFPTFTFSFPNGEDYNVGQSRTRMGMINEYARKFPEAVRTMDPLMSFCVIGKEKGLANTKGTKSLGEGSFFDNLHHAEDVKIAFLGANIGDCFTYQHYVEEKLRVPYRYDKEFTGKIINQEGSEKEETYTLYVKYRDVIPYTPPEFEEMLVKQGYLKKAELGNSLVSCFSEKDAYRETELRIRENVNYFLAEPYDTKPLVKEYSYGNVTTVQ